MAPHICPVWVGYLLACPLRKLKQDPKKICGPYFKEGQTVLDVGSAMGFFSLPMAEMVGPEGRVIAADIQQKMLDKLQKRATRAGVMDRVTPWLTGERLCPPEYKGRVDFALAFAVVHEIPDQKALFSELAEVLDPKGRLLVSEPSGHVCAKDFEKSLNLAEQAGFKIVQRPEIKGGHSALLNLGG